MTSQPLTRPDAQLAEALACHARGDIDKAVELYQQVLLRTGNEPIAAKNLAIARLQQGRLDEAAALLDGAMLANAADAELLGWKAEVLRRQGNAERALPMFESVLQRLPDFAPALFNLALAHADLGHGDAARAVWLRFLERRPRDRRVRAELGHLALAKGDYALARHWFAEQAAAFPDDENAVLDLARALAGLHEPSAAEALLEQRLQQNPRSVRALLLLGEILFAEGRFEASRESSLRAARLDPDSVEAMLQVGRACDRLARLQEAIDWFERAAARLPGDAAIRNSIAVAWLNFGEADAAITHFRKALALRPEFKEAHSNLLLALHYSNAPSAQEIFDEHLRWVGRHADFLPAPSVSFRHSTMPRRRLRIGYVSPRLCGGPMEHFLLPVLKAHDRAQVHVTCYATTSVEDEATRRMIGASDAWRACTALSDEAMVDRIRGDEIDILVDLAGHCPGNRLGVFARRAAPVQMTWMDYVDTTGIPEMDYFVTDEAHTPALSPQRFTESVLRMKGARFCYAPAPGLPPIDRSPRKDLQFIFGCFNRVTKLCGDTIAAWSSILANAPNSGLVLKATALAAADTREAIVARFVRQGAHREQLDFRPFSAESDMLAEYNDIDLALDPFPYSGCTTTCDALSMGVPVITLSGTRFASRHSTSLLTAVGCASWITDDIDAYVNTALRFASGAMELPEKETLRRSFLGSSLCDAHCFADVLEGLFVAVWSRWCEDAGRPR